MKRKRVWRVFLRAALGMMVFVGIGTGARAILEQFSWPRTATYVASVPAVVSSTPAAKAPTGAAPERNVSVPEPAPQPRVALSRASVEQSDTFTVALNDVPAGVVPNATWYGRTYDLAKRGAQWVGFLGVDAKQNPGVYPLTVAIGTTTVTREVRVAKRNFPVTVLAVTPELERAGYTPPAIQSNVAAENARLNSALGYTPRAYFSKPFVNPLDRMRTVGAYGNVRKSGAVELQHLGADLDAPAGTPVYATNDGVVNLAEDFVNYGKTIVVDHGLGIFSFYLHLDEFKVKKGERVMRGQVIAKSGNTGYSIAPHLHFSVRIRNTSVDPLRFIEAANAALLDAGERRE